jgi:hypothetical protein
MFSRLKFVVLSVATLAMGSALSVETASAAPPFRRTMPAPPRPQVPIYPRPAPSLPMNPGGFGVMGGGFGAMGGCFQGRFGGYQGGYGIMGGSGGMGGYGYQGGGYGYDRRPRPKPRPGGWLVGDWLVRPMGQNPKFYEFSPDGSFEYVELDADGKPLYGPDGNIPVYSGTYTYVDNVLTLNYADGSSLQMTVVTSESPGGQVVSALMIVWGDFYDEGWQFDRVN